MSTELLNAPPAQDSFDSVVANFQANLDKPAVQQEVKAEPIVEQAQVESKPAIATEAKVEASPFDLRGDLLKDETTEEAPQSAEETKEYPPEIRSIKAREHFDAVKAARKAAERERDTLRAEVEQLKAKSGVNAPEVGVVQKENEALKKRIEEYEKDMGMSHLQGTEKYKGLHSTLVSHREYFREVAKQAEFLPSDLEAALDEPDEFKRNIKISELADSIQGELNKRRFFDRVQKFQDDLDAFDELHDNAAGSMEAAKKFKEEEEAAASLKRSEEFKTARTSMLDKAASAFKSLSGNTDVWEKVKAGVEADDYEQLPTNHKALGIVAAHLLNPLAQELSAVKAELDRYKEIIKSRGAASPGASSGTVAQTQSSDSQSLDDKIASLQRSQGFRG